MCNCVSQMDEQLKRFNGRLAFGFQFNGGKMDLSPPIIMTEKIEKRKKGPPTVLATYCPSCGEKYKKEKKDD